MDKGNPNTMNREERRKYWKTYYKEDKLGTWQEFNAQCEKQIPIINNK